MLSGVLRRAATCVLWLVAGILASVWGAAIPIVNAGFESLVSGDGASTPSATGWTSDFA